MLQAGVEVWLPLVMSAFSALLAIAILLASFYAMRYLRMRRLAQGGDLATALLQPEVICPSYAIMQSCICPIVY